MLSTSKIATLCTLGFCLGSAQIFSDCDPPNLLDHGDFGPVSFANATWNGSIFFYLRPSGTPQVSAFPLFSFMHGSTGQYEMYNESLARISSHGFVVVFPFIKSPEQDTHAWVTNTDGTYLIKSIEFAKFSNEDPQSPLYGMVDTTSVVIAGHSMGGTDTIMAAATLPVGSAKVAIAMHPGLCGPLGPPPCFDIFSCSTWLKSDLEKLTGKLPILLTTATNDGAFRPAPNTAAAELKCFQGGLNGTAAFAQFSSEACIEDDNRAPFPDGGHDCPLKFANGSMPEWPWVLTAAKLYAQQGGISVSKCYGMLWGNGTDALAQSQNVDIVELHP